MTDTNTTLEVFTVVDTALVSVIQASQGRSLDDRLKLYDGFTNETILRWIQQVDAVHNASGSTLYDMVYLLYVKTADDDWTETLREIARATSRPYESLRKNFNKWLVRNDHDLSPEHVERRERAMSSVEEAGNNGTLFTEDDTEYDDEYLDDMVEVLNGDSDEWTKTPAIDDVGDADLDFSPEGEDEESDRRSPLDALYQQAADLRSEWIAKKTETFGDNPMGARAAESASEKLTSTPTGGVSLIEWTTQVAESDTRGYDAETALAKAEVDWWKLQLKNYGFVEAAIKPEVVDKKERKPKGPSAPKTKAAKLERAMEMVREVVQELNNEGIVAEDWKLIGIAQSLVYTLKKMEEKIKGETNAPTAAAPATSQSAPADWTPPAI